MRDAVQVVTYGKVSLSCTCLNLPLDATNVM